MGKRASISYDIEYSPDLHELCPGDAGEPIIHWR